MGAGRQTETHNFRDQVPQSPNGGGYITTRNLSKNKLAGIIFGCKHHTIKECLSNMVFGLPDPHFSDIKNIEPGLPLFIFHYRDRKLHGIYEAAGRMKNINPYGWMLNGSYPTEYPAQVRARVRKQCQPLSEEQFRDILCMNYSRDNKRFWIELDQSQTDQLISLFDENNPSAFTYNKPIKTLLYRDTPNPDTRHKDEPGLPAESSPHVLKWISLFRDNSDSGSRRKEDGKPSVSTANWDEENSPRLDGHNMDSTPSGITASCDVETRRSEFINREEWCTSWSDDETKKSNITPCANEAIEPSGITPSGKEEPAHSGITPCEKETDYKEMQIVKSHSEEKEIEGEEEQVYYKLKQLVLSREDSTAGEHTEDALVSSGTDNSHLEDGWSPVAPLADDWGSVDTSADGWHIADDKGSVLLDTEASTWSSQAVAAETRSWSLSKEGGPIEDTWVSTETRSSGVWGQTECELPTSTHGAKLNWGQTRGWIHNQIMEFDNSSGSVFLYPSAGSISPVLASTNLKENLFARCVKQLGTTTGSIAYQGVKNTSYICSGADGMRHRVKSDEVTLGKAEKITIIRDLLMVQAGDVDNTDRYKEKVALGAESKWDVKSITRKINEELMKEAGGDNLEGSLCLCGINIRGVPQLEIVGSENRCCEVQITPFRATFTGEGAELAAEFFGKLISRVNDYTASVVRGVLERCLTLAGVKCTYTGGYYDFGGVTAVYHRVRAMHGVPWKDTKERDHLLILIHRYYEDLKPYLDSSVFLTTFGTPEDDVNSVVRVVRKNHPEARFMKRLAMVKNGPTLWLINFRDVKKKKNAFPSDSNKSENHTSPLVRYHLKTGSATIAEKKIKLTFREANQDVLGAMIPNFENAFF